VVECAASTRFFHGDDPHDDDAPVPEIGPWAGDITKAKLPDRFLVDYVRVYDLVDVE
jgi:hypothetical protein